MKSNLTNPFILYEDNHLIAVVKRAGQTVQPEPGKPESLEEEVKRYIKESKEKPGEVFLGVIHRLDMPVSGIVLFAKTTKALVRMNEAFRQRGVRKIYEAWVENRPAKRHDKLTHWLRRDEKNNFTRVLPQEIKDADKAELIYEVIGEKKDTSLLKIELLTGRKHQIRAQLSAIGCPIAGDVKYGASKPNKDQSISLEAVELVFMHPVKKEVITLQTRDSRVKKLKSN